MIKKMEESLFATFFEGKHIINNEKAFNSEFSGIISSRYEDLLHSQVYERTSCVDHALDQQPFSFNAPFSMLEVKKAVSTIKTAGKSFDNYGFHPSMRKYMGTLSLQFFTNLFNICLAQGVWPWENSEVIFIWKAGKPLYAKPGAYRPISITSYVGKLLEKLICSRLQSHFSLIGLLDEDQKGFTKQRNTIRYLNRLDILIRYGRHNNKTVLGLFLDFEKAFDSVWLKGF